MRKKKGIKGVVGIKIDLQKAYDKVNWQGLLQILEAYGFDNKFILLIFRCLTEDNMKLLLNGSIFEEIHRERGIRQRDLLPPLLFVQNSYLE